MKTGRAMNAEHAAPQADRLKASKYVEALRLRVKEQREAGRENRRELRRAQRSLRAYEVIQCFCVLRRARVSSDLPDS